MNQDAIRWVDRGIGPALCFLLTAHSRIFRPFVRARARKPRKVVFIKWIEMGATVLAYPALRRAVEKYGRENVYFCVFKENREILDILDVIAPENVIPIRSKSGFQFVADVMRAIWRIRKAGIDTTIDMEFFARGSAVFAYLSGACNRVGLHRFTTEGPYRGELTTHKVLYNPYLHVRKAYYQLVAALDEAPGDQPVLKKSFEGSEMERELALPAFRPSEEERRKVQALLSQGFPRGVGRPLVILNPNASDLLPLRKWPTERFEELALRILRGYPEATIVFSGAPSERAAAEELCRKLGSDRVASLAGKTTLRELIVLYTLADALITNDSGPAHFSSMTNIHALILYGPETPELFGPVGPNSHVFWAKLACSPCVNAMNHRASPCTDNVCMREIGVDRVFAGLQSVLPRQEQRKLPTTRLPGVDAPQPVLQ